MFSVPNVYYLELTLKYEVFGEQGKAKFDGKRKILRVNLPVVPLAEKEEIGKVEEEQEIAEISPENPIETVENKEKDPSFLQIYQPEEVQTADIEPEMAQPLPEIHLRPSSPLPEPIAPVSNPIIEEIAPQDPVIAVPAAPLKPVIERNEPVYAFNQDASPVAHILFHVPGLHLSSLQSSLYRNGFKANWVSESKAEIYKTGFYFQFEGLITLKGSSITAIIDYVVVKLTKAVISEPWAQAGRFVPELEALAGEEELVVEPEVPVVVPEVPQDPVKPAAFSYIAFETPLLYELV